MLLGCVQPAMMPNINSATARVLDAAGIQTLVADEAGCCGALRTHLNDIDGGLRRHAPQHRRLVAAGRRPDLGGQGRGHRHERLGLRRHRQGLRPRAGPRCRLCRARGARQRADARPERAAARAGARCSSRSCASRRQRRLAFHPPCTLQHGQQLRGGVETHLGALGFDVSLAPQRKPPVLRLGRHLQRAAARAGLPAARPQAGAACNRCSRRPSSRPTSAASSTCKAARPRRCGTGWKCWTRRWPAERARRGIKAPAA